METINANRGLVQDIKYHNKDRSNLIAGEYFGAQYTYEQTFQMIEEYKKAFIAVDGDNQDSITICAPSTIASVNAFYGATEANKPINLISPGFLNIKTEYYTKALGAKTIFIYDGFLSDVLIELLYAAGVKNIVATSITDYMPPETKEYAYQSGILSRRGFADNYVSTHKSFPVGMEYLTIHDFVDAGSQLQGENPVPYGRNDVPMRFLTGATTSQLPKCVILNANGFAEMGKIYEQIWFDFQPEERLAVIIPLFYATGAIHGMHMGLIQGMTLVYKPKYDRFAFGKDLLESKANVALVAPSFVSTLENAGLADGSLNHVKYLFIGGEAINPAQMRKFRLTAKRLGIHYILNGYGMTETGGMVGISDREYDDMSDVSVALVPGSEARVVDPLTNTILPDGERGILHVKTPCATHGYFEKERNCKLFTKDGWINTGDTAVKYPNGRIRVFGRGTDFFTNQGKKYAMFDLEEKILELEGVAEAEVIKFEVNGQEYPAAVVVVKQNYTEDLSSIVKQAFAIDLEEMKLLIGIRFISHFKINPVTSKRDYLILQNDVDGYYSIDKSGQYYICSVGKERIAISKQDINIREA